ncbi:sigma-70 family RNA polymerase sigma factor [Kribbella sindirgiensis]|uniref:Sigma-70 family RNA polymerase sigma factor n=2 Tax=Kribbella sindirgiensis TaxID=1124744 RepID=A0A4R0IFZ0_9ACTN|nr:sigma-70 family RNA polymerase sigma factor [Kribbella sindirgiensis]
MGLIVGDTMTGSGAAFETLFRTEAGRLVRLAHLLGAEDPEDVVQEAFCRLYDVRQQREVANPTAYLSRIVVNEVRSRRRRRLLGDRKVLHLGTAEPADEHVVRTESVRGLLRALDSLAPRQREALVLRYWLDLPLAEIADAMQVRVGTVKSLVSRGLARLATELEDHR